MNQWSQKPNHAAHTGANQKRNNGRLKAEQEKENHAGSMIRWWEMRKPKTNEEIFRDIIGARNRSSRDRRVDQNLVSGRLGITQRTKRAEEPANEQKT
jgi:hypothetical protein